jgi:hypothetical protein
LLAGGGKVLDGEALVGEQDAILLIAPDVLGVWAAVVKNSTNSEFNFSSILEGNSVYTKNSTHTIFQNILKIF